MTNREKFKEEICDIAINGERLAVDRETLEPCACSHIEWCRDCIANGIKCNDVIKEWANSEYVEPCHFEDNELVEVSDNGEDWKLRYFSHQENGRVYCYVSGYTNKEAIGTCSWNYCRKYGTLGGLVKEQKE